MAGIIDEIARGGENTLGPPRYFEPGVGECDVAGPPFHQLYSDLALKFAHLHGQGRLGHGAFVSRPAEMTVAGERRQITKLTERDHGDKLILSLTPINTIRPDGMDRPR